MSGPEALALLENLHANSPRKFTPEIQRLIEAAQSVVVLSGWHNVTPKHRVFMSSSMAIDTLDKAIREVQNPTLRLAPEGIEPGRV